MLVVAIMEDTDGRDCSLLLTVRKLRKFSFPFCISENSEKAYVLSLFSLSLIFIFFPISYLSLWLPRKL